MPTILKLLSPSPMVPSDELTQLCECSFLEDYATGSQSLHPSPDGAGQCFYPTPSPIVYTPHCDASSCPFSQRTPRLSSMYCRYGRRCHGEPQCPDFPRHCLCVFCSASSSKN